MSPPRILLVARPGIGGAARVIERMLRRLPERGITGTAALSGLEGDALLAVARDAGWETVRLDLERQVRLLRDSAAGLRLRGLATGHDILHAHAAKAGALARLVAPRRLPVVYTPHGFYFTYHPEGSREHTRYLGLERRLAARTTVLHCLTESEQQVAALHALAGPDRAVVLPNAVPPRPPDTDAQAARLLSELGVAADERLVLMAARLAEPKDPLTFLGAAARLGERAGLRTLLIGDGPLLDSVRAQNDAGVLVPGAADCVRGLLARADVAVLATRSEALPMFLLEALAEGIPAVASDLPGCRAASAEAGLYAPVGDADALAAAIAELLDDAELHGRLAAAAAARAPQFAEDAWLDGLVRLYERATG